MTIKIELADAIGEVRRNLIRAQAAGEGESLRFRVAAVDLELQVKITEDDKIKGGIKAWVLDAGGEHAASEGITHTVKIKLEPVTGTGEEFKVSGKKPK